MKLQHDVEQLPSYQHMLIGLISGAMGPFSNAPVDTIKTRKYTTGRSLPSIFMSFVYQRFAEVTSYTRSERVPKDICDFPGHVASGGLPIVLQRNYPSRSSRCSRTGDRIRRIRTSEQAHGKAEELGRCRIL